MRCSKPYITDLEWDFVDDAMSSADIGVGKYIEKFEGAWAEYNNMKYAVACNSGTNALYLALKAIGIGPGDEVIVPEFTMVATAWAVSYTGATPVFIDCGDDLNIDTNLIEEAISDKTKAIIPVHIYGRQCNMDLIIDIALENDLFVVEDMAEAHGIIPRGDIACYSFYGNKILTTGEGGMCLTNDEILASEMRKYANMYFDKGRTLLHPKIGYNFRMTNIQAAIGYAQVLRIDEILKKRKQIAKWYNENLQDRFLMPKRNVVWMYDIDCGEHQNEVIDALKKEGIESRLFFKPMSMQPMYKDKYEHLKAYDWSTRGIYLPTYPDMTESDVIKVCNIINNV